MKKAFFIIPLMFFLFIASVIGVSVNECNSLGVLPLNKFASGTLEFSGIYQPLTGHNASDILVYYPDGNTLQQTYDTNESLQDTDQPLSFTLDTITIQGGDTLLFFNYTNTNASNTVYECEYFRLYAPSQTETNLFTVFILIGVGLMIITGLILFFLDNIKSGTFKIGEFIMFIFVAIFALSIIAVAIIQFFK